MTIDILYIYNINIYRLAIYVHSKIVVRLIECTIYFDFILVFVFCGSFKFYISKGVPGHSFRLSM